MCIQFFCISCRWQIGLLWFRCNSVENRPTLGHRFDSKASDLRVKFLVSGRSWTTTAQLRDVLVVQIWENSSLTHQDQAKRQKAEGRGEIDTRTTGNSKKFTPLAEWQCYFAFGAQVRFIRAFRRLDGQLQIKERVFCQPQ